MNGKILTVSTVLAVMLFTGCGGSDKSTRSISTNLGENIGLSTKSVATQQTPTVSTKSTLQTGTEFTISKDIKKDTVIGKVESVKLDGEILSLSLCGDYANYFSIDENGTLKLECDLPEDFEEVTLKLEAELKKDGVCKNISLDVKISVQKFDLTKGLVAYYEFDGDAKDSSGNGNDGTEFGGVSYIDGVIGKSASFDGVDDYIHIPQSKSLNNMNISTISFWTKYYKSSNNSNWKNNVSAHIINGGDKAKNHEYGYFNYSTHEGINFYLGYWSDAQGISVPMNATKQLDEQNYSLVSFVASSTTLKTYKNGILVNEVKREEKYKNFSRPTNDWYIGSMLNIYYLNGQIDDLRIYNRALSDGEIEELYKIKK